MMRTSRIGALVLALVVLLVASATAALGRVDRPGPIHGSAMTHDQITPAVDCPADAGWRFAGTGTGRFSHLGTVEFENTHCTWMDWETFTGEFAGGTTTITAANGDTLTLEHWGTFALTFGAQGPEYSIIALEWTVTGGTGRFVGATGSGTATAVGDLVAGTTTADYVGTIVYAASNRSAR